MLRRSAGTSPTGERLFGLAGPICVYRLPLLDVQGVGRAGERVVEVAAQYGQGAQAGHDDQSEHDPVLGRRRPVFAFEELLCIRPQSFHSLSPFTYVRFAIRFCRTL